MDDTVIVTTPKPKNPNRVAWAHELNRRKKMAKTVDQHIETQSQTVDQHSETQSQTVTGTFTKYLPWGIAGLCIAGFIFKERIIQKPKVEHKVEEPRRLIGNPFT